MLAWANNDFNLAPGGEVRLARGLFVSGDFFRVLAVPALLGRVFSTADDRPGCGLPGAVIGHAFWQREFGDDPSAVGRTLKLNDHPVEVIALTPAGLTGLEGLLITQADFARLKVPSGRRLAFVRDLLDRMRTIPGVVSAGEVGILPLSGGGVDNNVWEEFRALAFLSPTQSSEPDPFTQVVIRSPAPLTELISRVRSAVAEVDPAIGLDFRAFETTVREGLLRERMMAALSSFFGGLATLIAAIGLYGVMSFLVMRRTNEIGIRMALGADARNVLALVLPESATLLALGLLAGTGLALAAARTADAMLFGLKSYDPGTLALAAPLLAAVTGAATYLPARRAARLDPMAALREE